MQLPENGYLTTRCFYSWMGEDGIARTKTKEGTIVNLDDAQENSRVINSFEGTTYPLIVDSRSMKSMTKKAREHFTMKGRVSKVSSIAILADSALSRMIANFFLGVSKPIVPVKIFSKEEDAIDWSELKADS